TAAAATRARRAPRAGLITLAAAALLFAHATKETSVVLVPISLSWLAIESWAGRARGAWARFAGTYVAVNVAAAAVFAALRWYYAPLGLAEGTYTRAYALHPAAVGAALFRISAWLARDFTFLLPLLTVAVGSLVGGRQALRRPILYPCVWMAGWLAVYLPWPATFEYYLLPFAFGAAALAGTVVGDAWASRSCQHSVTRRRVAWSVLGASAALWFVAIVNASADARVQLAVDRANADLVDFLAGLPSDRRVRGDGGDGQQARAHRAGRARRAGRQTRQHDAERGVDGTCRTGVPGRAARSSRRACPPPTPLPCHREPAHRRHILPERSRGDRP